MNIMAITSFLFVDRIGGAMTEELFERNGRIMRATINCERTLRDGTHVRLALVFWKGGQVVGGPWPEVSVNGGPWVGVDFTSTLKLRGAIEACDSREDLGIWVIQGSQWPPYTKNP